MTKEVVDVISKLLITRARKIALRWCSNQQVTVHGEQFLGPLGLFIIQIQFPQNIICLNHNTGSSCSLAWVGNSLIKYMHPQVDRLVLPGYPS